MAIIKCKECGQGISNKADVCPHCGVKLKREPIGCGSAIALIVFIFWIASLMRTEENTTSRPDPVTAKPVAHVSLDDGKQSKRQKLIQSAIDSGVFQKVTTSSELPHLWVTPLWMTLDFDTKVQSVAVVYSYYHIESDGKIDLIPIYDSKSGKHIGRYGEAGLNLD